MAGMCCFPRCRFLVLGLLRAAAAFLVALSITASSSAQRQRPTLPPVEQLTLETKDAVLIRCTYFPGGVFEEPRQEGEEPRFARRPGKEVVPVILLHGWEGGRGEFDFLARMLQRRGHALLAPDLRGHGESTTRRLLTGAQQTVSRDSFRSDDLYAMVLDVEACKRFLLEKNNLAELNIELLCVIGADLGAAVALNWAQHDWNWPQLPTFKQGRDVKALVLLSPWQSSKV
jgi:pimeloyl-ACP methyl ester carboxylesterase